MSKFANPAAFPEDSPKLGSATDLRQRIEDAVENLLALLDALDGDPDSEPSLGAPEAEVPHAIRFLPERFPLSQERWAGGAADEREYDVGDQPQLDDGDSGMVPEAAHQNERRYKLAPLHRPHACWGRHHPCPAGRLDRRTGIAQGDPCSRTGRSSLTSSTDCLLGGLSD